MSAQPLPAGRHRPAPDSARAGCAPGACAFPPGQRPADPGLFDDEETAQARTPLLLEPGAMLLPGFALEHAAALLQAVQQVAAQAPWRHPSTPGGLRMSVALSNCGALGWVSDRSGYRYQRCDPTSGRPWPELPAPFARIAQAAAAAAGFARFAPDACLINRYAPGARLALHQDLDERSAADPIVSVSLGIPALFLWGGAQRSERTRRIALLHGDVLVWGGPARLRFHGVLPVRPAWHRLTGASRINLSLRKAG